MRRFIWSADNPVVLTAKTRTGLGMLQLDFEAAAAAPRVIPRLDEAPVE